MKRTILWFCILYGSSCIAQDFEGVLTYKCNTKVHLKEDINYSFRNPNKKKDSIYVTLNDSTLYNNLKRNDRIVDSIKIVFGKNRFRKTYYKRDHIQYIFNLASGEKITHTPKFECIDTTNIKLTDYQEHAKITESDSIFTINGTACKKVNILLNNYAYFDIYYAESEYKNLANAFIYETNNNFLYSNLYFLKERLLFKKILKLKYATKYEAVDFEYELSSVSATTIEDVDFSLPEYDYCQLDIFEDKKLMRKHRKKKRKARKGKN
ncbi:MAG: hypothetical protein HRT68_16485 [Flavobacteriaceae bacterium]|nr:hypothetical protein [Flavobacteriaceae bacterium]